MIISKPRAAFAALFALCLTMLWSAEAQAQSRRCLVTATSATQTVDYDPFNPSQLQINDVVITFTRSNGPGGAKPAQIDLYIQSTDARANGIQLIPVSVVGSGNASGLNQNIFYDFPGPVPNIPIPLGNSVTPGTFRWSYTGNNAASDVFSIRFQVVIPQNLDLTAADNLQFNIEYGCNGTGDGPPFSERATAPNAFTLDINVVSALQATFAGTALDFGEIGDVSTPDVLAMPATYVTPPVNYVRVQSSGPYEIEVVSANGYVMTPNGITTPDAMQRVGYRLRFLGQTRSNTDTSQIQLVCPRAGVGVGAEDRLYLQAQLAEGGVGKTVSPTYRDTLTVTLSPKIAGTMPTSGGECAALSGQF